MSTHIFLGTHDPAVKVYGWLLLKNLSFLKMRKITENKIVFFCKKINKMANSEQQLNVKVVTWTT